MNRNLAVIAVWIALPLFGTTISYTGGEQTFTAPTEGIYDVVAYGATGGNGYEGTGGDGAEIGGYFLLSFNEVLDIYVGGAGGSESSDAGGGGGGTFVVMGGTNDALVIAGGGGGASLLANAGNGLTTNGGTGLGGTGSGGGGGGGFLSAGANGLASGGGGFPLLTGGADYMGGGAGGYGGGGGGTAGAGGGAGGYSGGDGGLGQSPGGGGGSYYDPSITNLLVSSTGNSTGNGYVVITLVQAVPEPASMGLLALGLFAIPVMKRLCM